MSSVPILPTSGKLDPASSAAAVGTATTIVPDVPASGPNPPSLADAHSEDAADSSRIDASLRAPVPLFYAASLLWLLLGLILGMIAAAKLVLPELLADVSWLTYGRVQPAALNALTYGWAMTALIGTGLWLMARLCRVTARHGGVLLAAWLLWNLGLTLGVGGILHGDGTSQRLLDFPKYATPILFTAFVFISIWAVLMFRYRQEGTVYVSQWFLLAGFLWFPWVYATANLLLFFVPVQAAAQEAILGWYLRNVGGLSLALMALGIAYYVVPKVIGKPVHRYGLATFSFWTLLVFFGWSGLYDFIGGPFPAWMVSLSIVTNALLLLPVFAAYASLRGTIGGHALAMRHSPSLRFVMAGVFCLVGATLLSVFMGFRGINSVTHFTEMVVAQQNLFFFGFISLTALGGLYYVVPRLLNTEWASPALIRTHFWFSVVGLGLTTVPLLLGGAIQGLGLSDAKVPFIVITSWLSPLLAANLVGWLTLLAGQVLMMASCLLLLTRVGASAYQVRRSLLISNRPGAPAGRSAFASSVS